MVRQQLEGGSARAALGAGGLVGSGPGVGGPVLRCPIADAAPRRLAERIAAYKEPAFLPDAIEALQPVERPLGVISGRVFGGYFLVWVLSAWVAGWGVVVSVWMSAFEHACVHCAESRFHPILRTLTMSDYVELTLALFERAFPGE